MEGTRITISHYDDDTDELILRGQPLPRAPHCEDADEDPDKNVNYVQEVFGYTEKRAMSA